MSDELWRSSKNATCAKDGQTVAFIVVTCDDGTVWAWCQRCYQVHQKTRDGGLCPWDAEAATH